MKPYQWFFAGLFLLPLSTLAEPPANDALESAADLGSSTGISVTAANLEATTQEGAGEANDTVFATLWWRWTAPDDGVLRVDTEGTTFPDRLVAVYSGGALGDLTSLGDGFRVKAAVPVASGEVYHLQVGSGSDLPSSKGEVHLNVSFIRVSPVWRQLYEVTDADLLVDSDGDGLTGFVEAAFGSDPFDSASSPQLVLGEEGGSMFLSWFAATGIQTQAEVSLDLGEWSSFGPLVTSTGEAESFEFTPDDSPRFIRIRSLGALDSDGDGLDDFEEAALGTNPFLADNPVTTVVGTVVYLDGAVAPGVTVTVSTETGEFFSTTTTGEEGSFSVPDVPTVSGPLCLSGHITMAAESHYFIAGKVAPVPGGITATGEHTLTANSAAFVLIPLGTFQMGDSLREGVPHELPVHAVNVSAFFLQAKETTKAEWDEVRAWALENGYDFDNAGEGKGVDHPVNGVSWYDVVKWCNARSEMEELVPCYHTDVEHIAVYRTGQVDLTNEMVKWDAQGYRLPTDAEWEKAARGELQGRRFPWGDTITHSLANYMSDSNFAYDISETRGHHPDYNDGSNRYTSPVGSFAPNCHGLFDMTGNVREWCWDWYGHNYYASSPDANPLGPPSGSLRVFRGGSWSDHAQFSRVASRDGSRPSSRVHSLGFRPARGQ